MVNSQLLTLSRGVEFRDSVMPSDPKLFYLPKFFFFFLVIRNTVCLKFEEFISDQMLVQQCEE